MAKAATIEIDTRRLSKIKVLKSGSHSSIAQGACVMEAFAYVANLPWSDNPECVCPVIGAFLRNWNDNLPNDEERSRLLLPLIPKLVNTRGDAALEARRATMAADWYVRRFTPAWLRLAGLDAEADALSSFPEITSFENTPSIRAPLEGARKGAEAAWSAARSAARSAAWSAAWSAAESAAWSAAWSAARSAARSAAESAAWSAARSAAESAAWSAAWSAAESAAESAAWSAAWSAAESAAWSALEKTRVELQRSALDLVERMIAAQPQEAPAKRTRKAA